jgi:D-3-phosphoglycerate dehydrogenase
MFVIQTLDRISEAGLNKFPSKNYTIDANAACPDAILVRSYKLHKHHFPSSLKVVGRAGIGVDNIPIDDLTQKGIPLLYTPGANANAVKELVLAGLLMGCRQLPQANEFMRTLSTLDNAQLQLEIESKKKQFIGHEILEKTLGIIGLGSIGVKVANAALALGMQVLGYDPAMTIDNAWALSPGVKRVDNIDSLLQSSNFITLHVPLNDKTHHFINQSRLSLLQNDALLLNFSRANIVDEEAVLMALSTKKLGGYITDFPSVHLKNHPLVLCLPHLGASTFEAEENCAEIICERIRDFLEHGNIKGSVNFPDCYLPWLPQEGQIRLAITNRNIPGAIAGISQAISQGGFNINQMLNQSYHSIAYNLIDIMAPSGKEILNIISQLPGVLRATLVG